MFLTPILVLFKFLQCHCIVHQLVRSFLAQSHWTLDHISELLQGTEDSLINCSALQLK